MVWLISAKRSRYDHASAFAKFGFIDWRQNVTYEVGDIVYIYYGKPTKKVMYKCVVEKCNMSHTERVYDKDYWVDSTDFETRHLYKHARLKLIEQTDSEYLTLAYLQREGLIKNAPQKGQKASKELETYLNKYFNDYYTQGFFNDINQDEQYHEGHVINAKVNRYERSSIARMKCIEHHGTQCAICGMDFGKRYGDIGEGFIHVHHLKPLHSIGRDYVIDYKNDLIPVCPNCHAMIHRMKNGEKMTVSKLRSILGKAND